MLNERSAATPPQYEPRLQSQTGGDTNTDEQRTVWIDNASVGSLVLKNDVEEEEEQERKRGDTASAEPQTVEIDDEVTAQPLKPRDSSGKDFCDRRRVEHSCDFHLLDEILGLDEPDWKGWAEIENDPAIFTTILQEWGLSHVQVNDVFDMAEILLAEDNVDLLGLILLSKWLPPSHRKGASTAATVEDDSTKQPWFSNQISKFSCGTVALLNVILNSNLTLAEAPILDALRHSCIDKSAKDKGLLIDSHAVLRAIHNSFTTLLDRKIVDVMLKDDAQADTKRRKQANGAVREKRRKRNAFSKKKRSRARLDDNDDDDGDAADENGYHFVAYIEHAGHLWHLDGTEKHPQDLGRVPETSTWRALAAEHITAQTIEAHEQGSDYSLMSVTRQSHVASDNNNKLADERPRQEQRKDDWAPLIECLLRIHAERGDLNTLLRV